MKTKRPFKLTVILLIALPLIAIAIRFSGSPEQSTGQYAELRIWTEEDNADTRALVDQIEKSNPNLIARTLVEMENLTTGAPAAEYLYEAGPGSFEIDPNLLLPSVIQPYVQEFIKPGNLYPVEDPKLAALAMALRSNESKTLPVLQTFFEKSEGRTKSELHAFAELLNIPTRHQTEDLLRNAYLATLCRIIRLPARVVCGLESLENGETLTRYWTEIRVAHLWVPFVPGEGEFASLPVGYVKLLNNAEHYCNALYGTSTKYELEQVMLEPDKPRFLTLYDTQRISKHTGIPENRLALILLLPLAALIVGIFKTVIGVKTMGIFLPALISLTLIDTGLWQGLLLFTGMALTVATLHIPLSRWGIQYNAKLALMLTAVVVVALIVMGIGSSLNSGQASAPIFFPFVILTIVSERVAAKADESGLKTALELYGGSMLVTCVVYFIIGTTAIQVFFLENPEIIFTVAGVILLLGKWIGMRVTEYYRFFKLSQN